MEKPRRPFQGVTNIIRFNWHFYAIALFALLLLLLLQLNSSSMFHHFFKVTFWIFSGFIIISLLVSWYVYDVSKLYSLEWADLLRPVKNGTILNIHAGFDETSDLIQNKFPQSKLIRLDFYDSDKHTEISIKRARKAFPTHPSTISITTDQLPHKNGTIDLVFLIMAAHEIRNKKERVDFFTELKRTLKPTGQIAVVEHLRDAPNFLAYTIGFFHFYSKNSWKSCFINAGLNLSREIKITPFISFFILEHGSTS